MARVYSSAKQGQKAERRVAIYVRVSTLAQAEEGYSLDVQLTNALREARAEAARQGYADVREEDVHHDADSGKSFDREGLGELLAKVKSGEIGLVVFPAIDRMARSVKDAIEIKETLERYNTGLVLLKERLDTTTTAGNLAFQMFASFAEFEGRTILERTANGRLGKTMRGEAWSNGRTTPYGLKYAKPVDKHTPARACFVIVPEHAEVVRRIFTRAAGGASANVIAAELTADGVPAPYGAPVWRHNTVCGILRNTAYEGRLRRNLWRTEREPDEDGRRGKLRAVRRPEEEVTYLEIEPIVSAAVAERARANLGKNRARSERNLRYEYLLWTPRADPLLICGECLAEGRTQVLGGRARRRVRKDGAVHVDRGYGCIHHGPDGRRHRHTIGAERLEQAVWAKLCELLAKPENVIADVRALADSASGAARALEEELARGAAALAEIEKREARLVEMAELGTVPMKLLARRSAALNEERQQRQMRQQELEVQRQAAQERTIPIRDIEEACALVRAWASGDPPFETRRWIVRTLLVRIVAWVDRSDGGAGVLRIDLEGRLPSLRGESGEGGPFIDTRLRRCGRRPRRPPRRA